MKQIKNKFLGRSRASLKKALGVTPFSYRKTKKRFETIIMYIKEKIFKNHLYHTKNYAVLKNKTKDSYILKNSLF